MIEKPVLWTRTAQRDLHAVIDYSATDSVEHALSVLDRLQARAESLSTAAERGRTVPELRAIDLHHYREIIERPWRILYRVEPEHVIILAVLDGQRDLESLLLERLVRS